MKDRTKWNQTWAKKQFEKGMCRNCKNPHLKNQKTCTRCYLKIFSQNRLGNRKHWEALWNKLMQQEFKCYLTGIDLELGDNASIDHVVPLSLGKNKADDLDNIKWCEKRINRMKNDFLLEEFIQMCHHITKNW